MTDTGEGSPPAEVATVPQAGDGEPSVTAINMGAGTSLIAGDDVDHAQVAEDTAEKVKSVIPLTMSDADATKVGREIESRYLPPPLPPSVQEQIEQAAKPKEEPAAT